MKFMHKFTPQKYLQKYKKKSEKMALLLEKFSDNCTLTGVMMIPRKKEKCNVRNLSIGYLNYSPLIQMLSPCHSNIYFRLENPNPLSLQAFTSVHFGESGRKGKLCESKISTSYREV